MTLYSIQDTTLTSIGDALRRRHGETYMGYPGGEMKVSKTPNATGFDSFNGGYGTNKEFLDVVTLENTVGGCYVKVACQTESTAWDYLIVAPGELTLPIDVNKYTKLGGNALTVHEFDFDTNVVSFYFYSDNSSDNYLGYYAEVSAGPAQEFKKTFKPEEMAAAIDAIQHHYFTDEELIFSGNCSSLFANGNWRSVLEKEKDRIQIINVTNANGMFKNTLYEDLSWLTISSDNSNWTNMSDMFRDSMNLKKLPTVKDFVFYTNQSSAMFQNCYNLTDVDGIINFFKNNKFCNSTPQSSYWFSGCYSLRNIDAVMPYIKTAWETENAKNYVNYSNMFANCLSLDELNNIYVNPNSSAVTSNRLGDMIRTCARLKNLIFETNEDSSPIVVSWKSQTLDLSYSVGYYSFANSEWQNIYLQSSGITADKQVTDAASYAALKNDPDWFTLKEEYSRYNHDSAVNTINSLPDTSAYLATAGGTNTIKFKGAAGSATDGGAINTLTEEEIAVATAKGWTVTLS